MAGDIDNNIHTFMVLCHRFPDVFDFCTNPTRFSMTPSNASLSPTAESFRFTQYSNTSLALSTKPCRAFKCTVISSSVKPCMATSVVEQSRLAALMSNGGGGAGPGLALVSLFFFGSFFVSPFFDVVEATEVDDAFSIRTRDSCEDSRGESVMCIDGRMSFFCFEAGNISSRSTGTPSDTRNSRLILDRIQLGGWSGGGATS